jgi:hypothetical protein
MLCIHKHHLLHLHLLLPHHQFSKDMYLNLSLLLHPI